MVSKKEYILLSILSYCNFGEKECGRNILEIFKDAKCQSIIVGTFDILLFKNRNLFFKYFEKELEEWQVFYVDNRTAVSNTGDVSGFYSVVFTKDDKYVIAYRGSEKFPLEDAYKDFIETDLAIGMGKIPLQFYEGIEVFTTLMDRFEIKKEDITLTGHSLGGGIAQYVAITLDKRINYIPEVYTWNGVGINREGIITVLEFIDLKEILRGHTDLSEEEIAYFDDFNDSYLKFLAKELKRIGAIKDDTEVLVTRDNKIDFDIDEEFMKRLLKNTNVEACLMKFPLDRRRDLVINQNFFGLIFHLDNFVKLLLKAQKYIDRLKNNSVYEDRVFNFGHSEDLTNSLFRHVGTSYLMDQGFEMKKPEKNSFFNNFRLFTKSIQDLHFEDVFLAFISDKPEDNGKMKKDLNLDFIASSIRKLITNEYCLENRLLASYYSMDKIDNSNFELIRDDIISGLTKVGIDFLYKKKMIEQINEMDIDEFTILWEKIKEKLSSPYRKVDIFDVFIFN